MVAAEEIGGSWRAAAGDRVTPRWEVGDEILLWGMDLHYSSHPSPFG